MSAPKIPAETIHGEVLHTAGNEQNVAAAIRVTERLTKARKLKVSEDEAEILILPKGLAAHSLRPFLDEQLDAPRRRKGIASVDDIASFIKHVNRHKDAHSVIFANAESKPPSLVAVLNYNEAGPLDEASPRFGDHRTLYKFPFSEEWNAWTAKNAKGMNQAEFAEFIEDHILDVSASNAPSGLAAEFAETLAASFAPPSKLLELSRGLQVTVNSAVKAAVNLSTGEGQISYSEEHSPNVKVPQAFLLAIPVFRRDALYQIAVRLRYRQAHGQITWFYEMFRPERMVEHAVKEAAEQAAAETELPLFYGSPE